MRFCAAISLIACATLLLEITLSRVFSVLFFHHFAFLIISTALFGFGFSGIVIFFSKKSNADPSNRLSLAALLFSLTTLVVYKLILVLPHETKEIMEQPVQVLRLVGYYALLAVPFFFSGYIVGVLLSRYPEKSGKLYCFDLVGASLGCLAVLWLIPWLGASGTIAAASLLAAVSACVLNPPRKILLWGSIAFSVVVAVVLPRAEQYFVLPITEVVEEKYGLKHATGKTPEYSAWSPVSRIDVFPAARNKIIFLDGASNVSFLIRFGGDTANLSPRLNWRTVPYVITRRKTVCIIGPGGGEDVLNALSHGAESTTAVEMDPLIVDIVQGKYNDFIGRIYEHPSVRTVNDEGRSYLRRSRESYDLIQQVHNVSPMAIASGALNLSESYLLTVEAFREYWHHLKPDGMLAINRWGVVKAASIASVMLQREGILDPQSYVIVTARQGGTDTSLYLKKGRISHQDLQELLNSLHALRVQIEYAPMPAYQTEENLYYRMLVPSLREAFVKHADIVLEAPTDDRPFFDHFQRLGSFRQQTTLLPEELVRAIKFVNMGDLALFTLLAEAALLSTIFILAPVWRLRRLRTAVPQWAILCYFGALGLGFILIEITLIQKHLLFLGQPVYSISAVLFSLLISAGFGSLFFQNRFQDGQESRWLLALSLGLCALLTIEIFAVPKVFSLLLGTGKWLRFSISSLLIFPLGFVLGIPFPLGVRILGSRAPEAIPWGWALNAYTTVIGSILCVMLAITFGFRINFFIALTTYLIGILSFHHGLASRKV